MTLGGHFDRTLDGSHTMTSPREEVDLGDENKLISPPICRAGVREIRVCATVATRGAEEAIAVTFVLYGFPIRDLLSGVFRIPGQVNQ
jgi:hypothetical protein